MFEEKEKASPLDNRLANSHRVYSTSSEQIFEYSATEILVVVAAQGSNQSHIGI